MNNQIIENDRIHEQYTKIQHPSGLTVLLYPMKGYSSSYALFGTKYGSIDRSFKTDRDDAFVTVPDGIAHYLEHKLFENEEGDAFALFAQTGASANAFTSFDRTCYLFSCTDHFEQSLEYLLSFVQEPYFTKETVEKEQGIIGQEIRMYDDNPNWRVYFNTLMALYQTHPVRVDIAGTVDSIAKVNKDLLYRCYNTFYNLNNMVLAIAGNFDVDSAKRVIDKNLKPNSALVIERADYDEPYAIACKEIKIQLEVAVPLFCIGYKMEPVSGQEGLKAEIECELINDIIAGESSLLYRKLYDEGLISGDLGSEVMEGNGYFAQLFEGESRDPHQVYTQLQSEVALFVANGVDNETFERTKKAFYGRYVREFNDVETVASNLVSAHFSGTDVYDKIEIVANVTRDDILRRLAKYDTNNSVISIVEPV